MSEIVCPYCEYVFDSDDMMSCDNDLFAIVPNEDTVEENCPHCGNRFQIAGSYRPEYECSKIEDDDE